MFRSMRRHNQQVTQEECLRILGSSMRGVLAVLGDDGYPYTVPLDFLYDESDGRIYFHGAGEGHKIDAIERCDKVSFCVLGNGVSKHGDWALHITSVVAFGRIRKVTDRMKTLDRVRRLGLKYNPSAEDVDRELEQSKERVLCLEMEIEHITGKLVHEK